MPKLLFNLRHVPDDEAEEVRALLNAHGVDFYETSAGSWKTSVPALWLKDSSQLVLARQLLETYQQERSTRIKREYEVLKQSGEHRTFWRNFRESPFRVGAVLLLIGLVLYLSIRLFFSLG